ncbi:MAG TPA: protein kinase [Actinoallomurus sp.]|nr:protein kinase [Actinoallomurus sp.]
MDTPRLLKNRYRLGRVIGRGGMGVVWLATDEVLDRSVAVKEVSFPPGLPDEEQQKLRRRTLREARTTARLNHPNVVGVYDIVEDEDRPWIVMEFVPSRSLGETVRADGPLTPERTAAIGLQLLAGLRAAHAAGVLHRDVKPSNVLLAEDGRVVLGDFGIATAKGASTVTSSGVLIGSPSYMAPERARGRDVGPESDLWSLGATLYTAVEGRPPFDRDSAVATLAALVMDDPDAPARAGPLWPLIRGLLQRDPAERPAMESVASTLREIADGSGEAPPVSPDTPGQAEPAEPAGRPRRTRKGKAGRPAAGKAGGSVAEEAGPAAAEPPPAEPPPAEVPPVPSIPRPRPAPDEPSSLEAPPDEASPGPSASDATGTADAVEPGPADPGDAVRQEGTGPASLSSTGTVRGTGTGASRRVPVALAALALVLVVVLLGWAVSSMFGDDDSDRRSGQKPGTTPSGKASSPSPTASPTASATAAPPNTSPAVSPTGTTGPLPDGYHWHHDSTHFSIAVPDGWSAEHHGHYLYVEDPHSSRILIVDQSDTPKSDPLADWREQESARRSSYPGYHRIHLRSVDYPQARKAADWEFTYNGSGGHTHVLNRNILANSKHAYALYWQVPDSRWDASRKVFDVFAATFRPAKG